MLLQMDLQAATRSYTSMENYKEYYQLGDMRQKRFSGNSRAMLDSLLDDALGSEDALRNAQSQYSFYKHLVQHSAVQHSTTQHSMAQYSTIQSIALL